MARFVASKPPKPIEISRYLGVNEAVGETEIELGQAVKQLNWRITQNFKPQKRQGHKTFINYANAKDVQGMWNGTIATKNVLISCNDGKVYEYNFATLANTQIGTMTDARTTIFYFESKLYFLNGVEYKQYDGTTFADVDPYIPTVAIALPPAGGLLPELSTAQIYEPINLLTGKKKAEFMADGVATAYQLPETGLDAALVTCTVDGVTKTETVDFTVNRTTGIVTFGVAPADELEVIFGWTKVEAGNADLVKKNKYAMINGPGNDTAIFLWGNPAQKNRRSWSGTLKANYFPVINFTLVGSNEFAITDIKPVQSKQVIFKQDRSHSSYPEWNATAQAWDYPVFDLNEKVGNKTFNAVQIINDYPISIHGKSWHHWRSNDIEGELNQDIISERLRESLSTLDLATAVTFDYQSEKEYWFNVGSNVYIWNYDNDTMYTYDNISGTCYLDIDGSIYYGSQGTIERVEGLNDNGVAIVANLELGFTDFGVNHLVKNTRKIWITVQPESKSSLDVLYTTNKNFLSDIKTITVAFNLLDFGLIYFDAFSFLTNRAPQTYRKKIRAKKYSYIKFMLRNSQVDESVVIIALKLTAETTSEVK